MFTKTNQHNPPDKPPPTIPTSAFICVHLRLKISSLRGKTKPNHYFEQKETKETKILNTFETNSVFPRVNIYMFPSYFNIFVPFVAFCSKTNLSQTINGHKKHKKTSSHTTSPRRL
jgi:hypothetical protein